MLGFEAARRDLQVGAGTPAAEWDLRFLTEAEITRWRRIRRCRPRQASPQPRASGQGPGDTRRATARRSSRSGSVRRRKLSIRPGRRHHQRDERRALAERQPGLRRAGQHEQRAGPSGTERLGPVRRTRPAWAAPTMMGWEAAGWRGCPEWAACETWAPTARARWRSAMGPAGGRGGCGRGGRGGAGGGGAAEAAADAAAAAEGGGMGGGGGRGGRAARPLGWAGATRWPSATTAGIRA